MKPVMNWTGGKRRLLPEIEKRIPDHDLYIEPFLGGGAVWLHLMPEKAIIGDINFDVVNVYREIKDNLKELSEYLKIHEKNNNKEYFLEIRAMDRLDNFKDVSNTEKAARMIYLTRTCFRGIYRVNKKGQFNMPYNLRTMKNIVDWENLKELHEYLNKNNITIHHGSYEDILKDIPENSFVYLDPPYIPRSETSNFTGYTKEGFNLDDHMKLANYCKQLDQKGIKFLLSNSYTNLTLEIYHNFTIDSVDIKSNISVKKETKGIDIQEVLVYNY